MNDSTAPKDSLSGSAISLEVERRKPRLAWHGMDSRSLSGTVPTQVVEIVSPGRAIERRNELGFGARAAPRNDVVRPENRLIWTNDNLVALKTLLDERDPQTKDFRYRGRVDLIYIDPPFMVNNDFRAENAIEIDLDETAHIHVRKEPSLVEVIAYKDTWRQGLDSFLSMLRARLLLLRQFLSPSGSIFVHLDWHAVHYVKVLMDEIFGYGNFVNEIVWQRQTSHSDLAQGAKHLGRVHDTILVYRAGNDAFMAPVYTPHDASYVRSHYKYLDGNRRFRYDNLTGPGGASKGNAYYELMGHKKYWRHAPEKMQELVKQGRVVQPSPGAVPAYKRFLDEMPGNSLQDVWTDIAPINSQAIEALGYPTQKPNALLERIVALASPPGGLVLDCFVGSGTTAEAAERLGRSWIGIDNGKYGIHLARKRLIELHGKPRPPEKALHEYVECKHCKSIERKERPQKSPGPFNVRPFTVENMGVYQRASEWQGFQQHRSAYRDEMIKVFGGEPVEHSALLHGRKANSWVHVGPLDAPVSSAQVWSIAREAQRTSTKAVTILSADFDTLSGSDKTDIQKKTGVAITIRVIPASAIDEVKRRLDLLRVDPDLSIESTAIPAFYAPLSIVLGERVAGRSVELRLERCEVDIESFISSQRPILKSITDKMTERARKKALDEVKRWENREKQLKEWLKKAKSWQAFVDFWAVDWDYGRHIGDDDKPIFVTEWQSFRGQGANGNGDLMFSANFSYPEPGMYRIAARVTDVFGNDGIATVEVEIKK